MEAPSLWAALVDRSPVIASLSFLPFSPPPPFEGRLAVGAGSSEERVLRLAREQQARCGMPFWDALIVSALGSGTLSGPVCDAITFVQPVATPLRLSRQRIGRGDLDRLVTGLPAGGALAVRSHFGRTGGGSAHLPLLDARCKISAENQAALIEVGRRLIRGRWLLLESGRSYHLIGLEPVSTSGLINILSRSLLFAPLLDRVFLAHHLQRGWSSLRISRGGRDGAIPKVVAIA